ncbi:hypothetical protein DBR06_SOUSAS8910022, partial [Sousa chinensis]
MLANAALVCLFGRVTGRPAFPHNRVYLVYFACVPRCYAMPSHLSFPSRVVLFGNVTFNKTSVMLAFILRLRAFMYH